MSTTIGERGDVREGKRVIWWNVAIGLFVAGALDHVLPSYQVFITLLVLIRILAIVFEYMLFRAFRQVSLFTAIPGITYAWGAAFLSTVATYSYEVGEAAFHYGMNVSPYYQVPPNILLGIEGIALLFLGYYFGKLPHGYGKLASYGRALHVLFGIVLLAHGAVAASASVAYLTALTFPLAALMLLLTVLVEYMILSRTMLLRSQGSVHYMLPQAQPRGMFDHMGDFGYMRSAKQAIGFYFVYLITIFVSYILLILVLRLVFPDFDYVDNATLIGSLSSALVCVVLAFIVTHDRHALKRYSSIVLLVLTLLVSLYAKLGVGLALVAYMTTRRGGASVITTTAPTPLPYIPASAAPFPPHHDPTHLALLDNDVDQVEEVHISAAAVSSAPPLHDVVHDAIHDAKKPRALIKRKITAVKNVAVTPVAPKSVSAATTKPEPKPKRIRKAKVASVPEQNTVLEVKLQKEKQKENSAVSAAPASDDTKNDTKESTKKDIVITSPVIRDVG